MTDFSDLESPIHNVAITAQILAKIYEDAQFDAPDQKDGFRLTGHEAEMLGFLIYDLCLRTKQLDEGLQELMDADFASRRKAA